MAKSSDMSLCADVDCDEPPNQDTPLIEIRPICVKTNIASKYYKIKMIQTHVGISSSLFLDDTDNWTHCPTIVLQSARIPLLYHMNCKFTRSVNISAHPIKKLS